MASSFELYDGPEPANGSWVAELEEAKEELATLVESRCGEGANGDGRGAVLEAHLRICRAYRMLRQWDRLSVASKKGLAACQSRSEATTIAGAHAGSLATLREYRRLARAELSVKSRLSEAGFEVPVPHNEIVDHDEENPSYGRYHSWMRYSILNEGYKPHKLCLSSELYRNADILQDAALAGDVRLMEAIVALGAAIDLPFSSKPGMPVQSSSVALPSEASALVMACLLLAIADSTGPTFAMAKHFLPRYTAKELDGIEECAMQLVRLGADPTRKLGVLGDPECCFIFRIPAIDGKTAFQIAAMSKRRALVALMWEHMQLGGDQRAGVVHCRCGSRLPWRQCHSTGVGQPPHYWLTPLSSLTEPRAYYRVSPLARCPCGIAGPGSTGKTYYKCCWKDNASPMYLMDEAGDYLCLSTNVAPKPLMKQCFRYLDSPGNEQTFSGFAHDHARLFRESPSKFLDFCAELGPKSKMSTWDPAVYAGCLERLDRAFFWSDVHWDLDRSALIRQAGEWNKALQQYCDDVGLQGKERTRVVEKHMANPCGPCGYAGCDAFEKEVREFERCSRCKAIAYCTRACQRNDWPDHRKVCRENQVFLKEDVLCLDA